MALADVRRAAYDEGRVGGTLGLVGLIHIRFTQRGDDYLELGPGMPYSPRHVLPIGRFRYITSRAER